MWILSEAVFVEDFMKVLFPSYRLKNITLARYIFFLLFLIIEPRKLKFGLHM